MLSLFMCISYGIEAIKSIAKEKVTEILMQP